MSYNIIYTNYIYKMEETIHLDLGLHACVSKYLSVEDVNEYTKGLNLDTAMFWNLLLIQRYPCYNIKYQEGYSFKEIYLTLMYIERYRLVESRTRLFHNNVDEFFEEHRAELLDDTVSDIAKDPRFTEKYSHCDDNEEYPNDLLATLLHTPDYSKATEYLIMNDVIRFDTNHIEYHLSDIDPFVLIKILDRYTIETDRLYDAFGSSLRKNDIKLSELFYSKIKDPDMDLVYRYILQCIQK